MSDNSRPLLAFNHTCLPDMASLEEFEVGQTSDEIELEERKTPYSNIRPVIFEMFTKSCSTRSIHCSGFLGLVNCPLLTRLFKNPSTCLACLHRDPYATKAQHLLQPHCRHSSSSCQGNPATDVQAACRYGRLAS